MNTTLFRICALLIFLRACSVFADPCPATWSAGFRPNSIDGYVRAVTTSDWNRRPGEESVFVAGRFSTVPGATAKNVAMWDGTLWRALGGGLNGEILSLALFDMDENGPSQPMLYAAGFFALDGSKQDSFIARWDGTRWYSVSGGLESSLGFGLASSMAVFDPDESGPIQPSLFVTGRFDHAGGTTARGCAKWDGKAWLAVDSGIAPFQALQVIDFDGSGPRPPELLGAGFISSGNISGGVIVRWNGAKWEVFEGLFDGQIHALAAVDLDGDGPEGPTLFAGGSFESVDGVAVHGIARWTESGWSDLSGGVRQDPFFQPDVSALLGFDFDGDGPDLPLLAIGGSFSQAGTIEAHNVAFWNGSEWFPIEDGVHGSSSAYGLGRVFSLATLNGSSNEESQRRLIAGGDFAYAGMRRVEAVSVHDGDSWGSLAASPGLGMNAPIAALIVHDEDGDGAVAPALYASGYFSKAGAKPANYVARLTGDGWEPLGEGMSVPSCDCTQPSVRNLASFDADGEGENPPVLIAAGSFLYADSVEVNSIAQWNGEAWSSLSEGLHSVGSNFTSAMALVVFDDDFDHTTLPALYVGGAFSHADHLLVNNVARWDGTAWSAVGNGLTADLFGDVRALAVFDDESSFGPSLFAVGSFTQSGSISVNRIAKWNGLGWEPLGSGLGASANALIVFDADGDGPESPVLIAAGYFETAGGVAVNHVAQWDGFTWSALGLGLNDTVFALHVFDLDGPGPLVPSLIAGGSFTMAGGLPAGGLAAWDGTTWTPLTTSLGGSYFNLTRVNALASIQGLPGSAEASLFVAGDFFSIDGLPSAHIAQLSAARVGDIDCDGSVTSDEFADFAECLLGPSSNSDLEYCDHADVDFDGDVDLADLARLMNSMIE